MAQKIYIVEGRQFRTESDYARAQRDKEIIDTLRKQVDFKDKKQVEQLYQALKNGKYKFATMVGQDFLEELEEIRRNPAAAGKADRAGRNQDRKSNGGKNDTGSVRNTGTGNRRKSTQGNSRATTGNSSTVGARAKESTGAYDETTMQRFVQEELKKREQRRKWLTGICAALAVLCLGYFGFYNFYIYRTERAYEEMADLKDKYASIAASNATKPSAGESEGPLYTLDTPNQETKEVLEKYKKLFNQNKKLIGWVKIADTNIDYPVMQTSDNEYYLDHNLNQEYDKNGSIFMDKDCDVLKPSTNFILYGHHMQSGKMFGKLHLYEKESYFKEHPYIQFDTIYEEGLYEIMYVFRSRVYGETEIVFKYYQFIDADSEQEFNSYMEEMKSMSFYDTGVTAQFGDQLLTLSTCDYEEKNGRFVVVAKKIAKE